MILKAPKEIMRELAMSSEAGNVEILAFYKFTPIQDPRRLQQQLKKLCLGIGMRGSILLGKEGINATVSGDPSACAKFKRVMAEEERFQDLWYKTSFATSHPFKRMTVKLKKEIVTMGVHHIDPRAATGKYLAPETLAEWLENEKDIVMIDVRNDYEISLGKFKQALDPETKSFREFPAWVNRHRQELKDKTIVTYCTGGIRCEKATAYMQEAGYENVYQIHGGVLNFLESAPEAAQKHWQGQCFVFDDRMALTLDLQPSQDIICPTCINTITSEQQKHPSFVKGKQCPHCAPLLVEHQQKRSEKGLEIHYLKLRERDHVSKSIRDLRSYFTTAEALSWDLSQ